MDLMDVADPDIMNCLIEMCNVDCVLLIADKAEARRVMFENPPPRAKSVSVQAGVDGRRYACFIVQCVE